MIRQLLIKIPRVRRALAWSPQRRAMEALLRKSNSTRHWTAAELAKSASIATGSIYPLLTKLEKVGVLESHLAGFPTGKRQVYGLNPANWEQARIELLLYICSGVLRRSVRRQLEAESCDTTLGEFIGAVFSALEAAGIDPEGFLHDEEYLE